MINMKENMSVLLLISKGSVLLLLPFALFRFSSYQLLYATDFHWLFSTKQLQCYLNQQPVILLTLIIYKQIMSLE